MALPQEKPIHCGGCHGKSEAPDSKESIGQAISSALKRQQAARGGAALAGYFDGREGREVAQSTVSRWISEPSRFPAVFVGVLSELDQGFRTQLVQAVMVSEFVPESVVQHLPPSVADEYRRVIEQRFLDMVYGGPSRHGEHY